MVKFAELYPDRYFDVGIAEQHAVTFAAGLACEGYKPVVAIYSTFLQRAYDQLIHDVQIQNLPILFAIDRAGLVGADGATHNGSFDLTYLRCLPNMTVMTPSDENECRQMLYTGVPDERRRPRCAIRAAPVRASRSRKEMTALPIGKGEIRRAARAHRSKKVAILAFGCDAEAGARGRGGARCDRRQHALRQAARRGAGARARGLPTICW